jgi:hypothetical protein
MTTTYDDKGLLEEHGRAKLATSVIVTLRA